MSPADLELGARRLRMGGITHVVGVINLSPESRNEDTVARSTGEALAMAARYREWGASIMDVGAQSSHFDSPEITVDLEVGRLVPAVAALVAEGHSVSVDTWRPEVARAALDHGAVMINDTGGLQDAAMREVVASVGAAVVAVYIEAANPHRVGEVSIAPDKAERTTAWFRDRIADYTRQGIRNLVLDPGIAISYRGDYAAYTRQQIEVIRDIALLQDLGFPVLIPIPRKREHHRVMAYLTLAIEHQVDLIRVHDVEAACDLVRLLGRSAHE